MGTFGGGLAVGMSMVQPSGGGGAIPDVTVATFADLPTTRPDGYLVAVTAQSGLTEVIVRWDDGGGVWLLEQATCSYTDMITAQLAGGEWYDTGGITVNSAAGATVYESTYDRSMRWRDDATPAKSAFWPSDVYEWIDVVGDPVVGDDATPTGWTDVGTVPPTTNGTDIVFAASLGGAGSATSRIRLNSAGMTNAGKSYMVGIFSVPTLTATGANSIVRAMLNTYDGTAFFRMMHSNATVSANSTFAGRWGNGVGLIENAPQQSSLSTPFVTETLVEIVKLGNRAMSRAGGSANPWHDISGANCEAGALNAWGLETTCDVTSGTASVELRARHVIVGRS